MGIPAYFRVITQQHKGILHRSAPCKCDHYFVDFNGLVHQAGHQVLSEPCNAHSNAEIEQRIITKTWGYLQNTVSIVNPYKMVHTCVDGVAPKAKMNQQRKRRYLSVHRNKLCGTTTVWDTNAISPGTKFMTQLNTAMHKRIRETPSEIIHYFSGADEHGEGEHKIFSRMNMVSHDETAFIYGLDADLIMLSLISHHPRIYLMREDKGDGKGNGNGKDRGSDPQFIYLDIKALRVALFKDLNRSYSWTIPKCVYDDPYCETAKDIIESYVTICFLLGNDFLPHIPTLSLKKEGYEKLLIAAKHAYDVCGCYPVSSANKSIHTKFLSVVLEQLSAKEDAEFMSLLEEYIKKRPWPPSDDGDHPLIHCYAIQEEHKDPLAKLIYNNGMMLWRNVYYKHLFQCDMHDTATQVNACKLFFQGIYWTYCYYKRLPKDADWIYPYNFSPSVLNLSNYVQGTIPEWDAIMSKWTKAPMPGTPGMPGGEFVDSAVQLLSILPLESKHLVPEIYQSIMTNPENGCAHMYPTQYKIQTFLKTQLWECTPLLPTIDTQQIAHSIACIDERAKNASKQPKKFS